jgi:hypothetical protein
MPDRGRIIVQQEGIMSLKTIRTIYLVGGIYDMVVAVVFGLFFKAIYLNFGVELPNHDGYIQITAAYIFVFGVGYYLVYKNPFEGLGLVIIGILMKLGFCVVVFGHYLFGSIPAMYIPFGLIDLIFGAIFLLTYAPLKKLKAAAAA